MFPRIIVPWLPWWKEASNYVNWLDRDILKVLSTMIIMSIKQLFQGMSFSRAEKGCNHLDNKENDVCRIWEVDCKSFMPLFTTSASCSHWIRVDIFEIFNYISLPSVVLSPDCIQPRRIFNPKTHSSPSSLPLLSVSSPIPQLHSFSRQCLLLLYKARVYSQEKKPSHLQYEQWSPGNLCYSRACDGTWTAICP